MPSWDSQAADKVWTEACGKERWRGTLETTTADMRRVPDEVLWHMRAAARDDLPPEAVQVELYADPMADKPPVQQAMSPSHPLIGALHGYLYSACVPASRPVHHYTPGIVPHHAAAAVPLEAAQILWQR